MKRKISLEEILIHIFSWLIILIAGYFYLERTLPFDAAFYSFRITETKWFCIDNYRYGVQHTQLLPLLLMIMGCSLKTFLISYSVSFALCNYIIALIILYGYKNSKLALGLVLASVLAYMYKFFYPVSEIHSITAPLFLFAAHVFHYPNKKNNFMYFFITAVIITWTLFIHVISVIPALYVLAYYYAYTKKLKENAPILVFASAYWVLVFWLSKTFLTTKYLASKMIGLKELVQFIKNPNEAFGYMYFKEEFLMNYLPLEILILCCLLFLLFKKEWLQVLVLVAFLIGTWFVIMAYNLHHDAPIVLMNYYGLFGFYCAFPFCVYIFDFISKKKFVLVYAALMVSSLWGIIRCGAFFTDHINYIKRVTAQTKNAKNIVSSANIPWDCIWVSWDLSFESLLASSIQNPACSKTFFTSDTDSIIHGFYNSPNPNDFYNVFFSPRWFMPPFQNSRYYQIAPSGYQWLNTLQDSSFNEQELSKKNVLISSEKNTVYLFKNRFRFIPITVTNKNNFKIPSIPSYLKQVRLSYHVYDRKNKLLFHDGRRSTLESDIEPNGSIETGLCIDCSQLRRGVYYIDADVVVEGSRWLGINQRIKIVLL
ncbi:MAG: hypothetical protein JST67_07835 [Bacteroidetes bacterium]|nr:hypothetical protein [Bacteroidota bacterium]